MELSNNLRKIHQIIEAALDIRLMEAEFATGGDEISPTDWHDACHAAVLHCVPWIQRLDQEQQVKVGTLMAHFLALALGLALGLPAPYSEDWGREVQQVLIIIDRVEFDHLLGIWQAYFWPQHDLAGMAAIVWITLRHRRMVYHILPRDDWLKAQLEGTYQPSSLAAEGFIHCSYIDQVLRSANAYFKGHTDLVLLWIASEKVSAEIRDEDLAGERICFPHIYGPLNLDAVVHVADLDVDHDGRFVLAIAPAGLAA